MGLLASKECGEETATGVHTGTQGPGGRGERPVRRAATTSHLSLPLWLSMDNWGF